MVGLIGKYNENIIKLLINKKTDFKKKNKDRYNPLDFLFMNYKDKKISLILSLFYFVDDDVINIIKLVVNDFNCEFFLEISEFREKDIFGWNMLNYSCWNKRKGNVNYLLIFAL